MERPTTLTEAFKDEDSKIRHLLQRQVNWALQELSKNSSQKSEKEYSISLHNSNPANMFSLSLDKLYPATTPLTLDVPV